MELPHVTDDTTLQGRMGRLNATGRELAPWLITAVFVAVCAQFLADHYATPAMLLGIAMGFLGAEGRAVPGISFAARTLLRLGVAFLGVRISARLMLGLAAELIGLVGAAVLATIGFGLLLGRILGAKWRVSCLGGLCLLG